MVNLKEYNNIKEYLVANPDGTYEQWFAQYKPKREKKQAFNVGTNEWDADWVKFWKCWPRTPNFEYKGMKFTGNRSLLGGTELKCKNQWLKAVLTGINPDIILKAAQIEIALTRDESYRKRENKMQYMPMMITWLNQERWKNWDGVEMPTNIEQGTAVAKDYQTSI